MEQLRLDWCNMCEIKEDWLQEILAKHKEVFKPELGKLQGFQAKLHIQEVATPKFHRAGSVPYSMKARIEEELDRFVNLDILQPVQFSDWATPVVPVLKPDNLVCLCGDYKVTKSRDKTRTVPNTKNSRPIRNPGRREEILEIRHEPSIPTDKIWQNIQEIHSD